MPTADPTAAAVQAAVDAAGDPERAAVMARFFKTGPGEYGEGDVFVGVTVPELRRIAREFRGIDPAQVRALLESPVHEHRRIALTLLRTEFERAVDPRPWVQIYLDALRDGCVDNWDLVDASADSILGEWLRRQGDHHPLVEMAGHPDLWVRRVGIVGTFAFIRHDDPAPLLEIAPSVIDDRRDLIQKAFGWTLREIGKRIDERLLTDFLSENAARMGRTALSYAVERLTPEQRAHFRALR
ncbi:DNA alkylation repair protein [Nakamurella flava]|uniref:DNA alkylation repair protein n=1 Tax=Nakamurella flava TaxID=2576308 RepID=A0A4U6QAW0_9ACTN|nr:DNA alkylation repair protein [Nakamurella flava]